MDLQTSCRHGLIDIVQTRTYINCEDTDLQTLCRHRPTDIVQTRTYIHCVDKYLQKLCEHRPAKAVAAKLEGEPPVDTSTSAQTLGIRCKATEPVHAAYASAHPPPPCLLRCPGHGPTLVAPACSNQRRLCERCCAAPLSAVQHLPS